MWACVQRDKWRVHRSSKIRTSKCLVDGYPCWHIVWSTNAGELQSLTRLQLTIVKIRRRLASPGPRTGPVLEVIIVGAPYRPLASRLPDYPPSIPHQRVELKKKKRYSSATCNLAVATIKYLDICLLHYTFVILKLFLSSSLLDPRGKHQPHSYYSFFEVTRKKKMF